MSDMNAVHLTPEEYREAIGVSQEDFFALAYDCYLILPKIIEVGGQLLLLWGRQPAGQHQQIHQNIECRKRTRRDEHITNKRNLLSFEQFQNRFRLTTDTLFRMAIERDFPSVIPLAGRVHFIIEEVEEWELGKRKVPTSWGKKK